MLQLSKNEVSGNQKLQLHLTEMQTKLDPWVL